MTLTMDEIKSEHKMMRQGKEYVLFAGLLDAAHKKGLLGINTELVQIPGSENGNVAVVRATVGMSPLDESPDGKARIFSGIGDASPDNVGRNIVPHIIRMAETRAKARALRDAVNVGGDLADDPSSHYADDEPPVASNGSSAATPAKAPAKAPAAADPDFSVDLASINDHKELMRLVRKHYNAIPEDQRTSDWDAVFKFSNQGVKEARANIRKLREKREGLEANA